MLIRIRLIKNISTPKKESWATFYPNEFEKKIVGYEHVAQGNYECVAREVKDKIIGLVESQQIGACYIYYNKFKKN